MRRFVLSLSVVFIAAIAVHAQDPSKEKLAKSPRHGEWVKVQNSKREVVSFVVYPEVKDKAKAVVVIHEIYGMTDWVRSVADQLAEAGYIAIAPDLLSGMGPKGGGTAEIAAGGDVRMAIMSLPPDQITADLNACVDYVTKLPACNGTVAVGGFCWGGGQAFRFATNNKAIKSAFVFYGPGPDKEADAARIVCPVYGFYGGADGRISLTLPKTTEVMKKAGKIYEPVTYEGAGHGFMRAGEDLKATAANKKARDEAWKRWKELLGKL